MQNNPLTDGPLLPSLVKFSLPLLLALCLQAMYGAADLMIVGRFGDATGVSAVSTGSQITHTITVIITGLTMGPTILVGHHMGAKEERQAAQVVGTAIGLFAIVALVITILATGFTRHIVAAMQAPPEAVEQTVQYVFICSLGTVFIVAYNAISGIIRGTGNAKLPLIFVAIACVVNVVLDLLLVGVFQLDAMGAAMATVFAQAVSVVLSLIIVGRRGLPFPFSRRDIRFQGRLAKKILRLGSPIALQDALTSLSFLVITGILNSMGLIVSAGVGVAEKIIVFIMLVPAAYMSAISAFVAQNMGAGHLDRAKKSMTYGIGIALIFGVLMFFLSFFAGDRLAGIFSRDTAVIGAAALYLKAYSIDCVLVCLLFGMMGFFNGCGKTVFVMAQGLTQSLLIRIPVSWLISRQSWATMFHIGLAAPLATVLGIVMCMLYYRHITTKSKMLST